ncbi:MAG: chromate transporter [Alphaproteobacteria bacterium]|nr:chromate transporter [Alphaproteobacteria bacterium]
MRENASTGETLLALMAILAPLSIASIGGAMGIYAPLQHEAVTVKQWITPQEFLDLFAVARFLPGPSSIIGAMIGMKVAGLTGAIVAMLALYVPSSALCYGMARVWNEGQGKAWNVALRRGLTPIAAGLIMAGVLALFQLSGGKLLTGAVLLGAAALLTWKSKMHPFPILFGGAIIFEAAWLMGLID